MVSGLRCLRGPLPLYAFMVELGAAQGIVDPYIKAILGLYRDNGKEK